jgi:ubiquinone/menaquinone biosynthesis C-methylase UbiE
MKYRGTEEDSDQNTVEYPEPSCDFDHNPVAVSSKLETAIYPEVVIDLGRESNYIVPSVNYDVAIKLKEIEEEYIGRDDEPIIGIAAEEFDSEAQSHPERYAYLAKWFLREASHRRQPRSIIDAGCGPGILTRMIAKDLPETSLIGVDISPDMLRLANQNNNSDKVRFVWGDVRNSLEIAEQPVDAIVSRRMIHRVDGLDYVLGRMIESVKADGGVVLNYSFRRPTDEAAQRAFIEACAQRASFKELHAAFIRAVLNAPTLEQYIEACRYVGRRFDLSHCHIKVFPFDIGIALIR